MSCRKPSLGERGAQSYELLRSISGRGARPRERHIVSLRFRSFVLCITSLVGLCALAPVWRSAEAAQAQVSDAEKTGYADALAYCRGNVARPMALRSDNRVLCLDGQIYAPNDFLLAHGLEQRGLLVVRGSGGGIDATIALADMLLAREATVIVNDYCLGTCANYLFIASLKTFVPKDALVAWISHGTGHDCVGFSEMRDPTAPYLRETPCAGSSSHDARTDKLLEFKDRFYKGRIFASAFVEPPESILVRRILKRKFDATGEYPVDVYWTWNPRYYASAIRTRIIYEAYPQSQDELDAIVTRIGLHLSVIYDP